MLRRRISTGADPLTYFAITGAVGLIVAVRAFLKGQFSSRPMFIVFVAAYAALFGIVPLTLDRHHPVYSEAGLTSLLGLAGLVGGWLVFGRMKPRPQRGPLAYDERRVVAVAIIFTTAMVLGFFIVAIGSAGSVGAFLDGGRFRFRGAGNPLLFTAGSTLIQSGMVPAFLLTSASSRLRRWGYVYAGVSAVVIYWAFAGSRAVALGILGAAVIGRLWGLPHELRPQWSRRSLRQLSGLGLVAIVFLYLVVVMYDARSDLRSEGLGAVAAAAREASAENVLDNESVAYGRQLLLTVDRIPRDHDFMWAYPVRRVLFFYLPTGGLKPPDPPAVLGDLVVPGARLVLPPSLPGEGYAVAGGLLGVGLWLFFYGQLGAWVERRARTSRVMRTMLGSALFYLVLVGMRGQLYGVAVVAVTQAVMVWAADWFVRRHVRPGRVDQADVHPTRSATSMPFSAP